MTLINQGKQLLLFAGYKGDEERFNDVHLLDLGTLTWTRVEVAGPKPKPRNTHSAVLLADEQRLVIFGGRDEHTFFDDCWILDLTKMRWREVITTGTKPRGRSGHSAVLVRQHSILIFGGWGGGYRRFGDLFELNLDTEEWHQHTPMGDIPAERSGHAACLINPSLMMLFGGWGQSKYRNDVRLLDMDTLRWCKARPNGDKPDTRRFHALAFMDHRVYLYGGRNEEKHFKDLHALLLGPRPLRSLCVAYAVAHYTEHLPQLAMLPEEVQHQVRLAREKEEKRQRRLNREDDAMDEENEDEEEEEIVVTEDAIGVFTDDQNDVNDVEDEEQNGTGAT